MKAYSIHWTRQDLDYLIALYSDAFSHQREIKLLAESLISHGNLRVRAIDVLWQEILLKRVLRAIYRKLLIKIIDVQTPTQADSDNKKLLHIIAKALDRDPQTVNQDINFFQSHPNLKDRLDYMNTNKGFLLYVDVHYEYDLSKDTLEKFKEDILPLLGNNIIVEAGVDREFLHSIVRDYSYIAITVPEDTPEETLLHLKTFTHTAFTEHFDNCLKFFGSFSGIFPSFPNKLPELLEETAGSPIDENDNSKIDTKGGVDFTGKALRRQLTTTGNSVDFQFTPEMINNVQNAPGFVPVITNTQPLINLHLFLGAKEKDTLSVASQR